MKSLTTGEISKHCNVNYRTVIRWIEKGLIKGYKHPGRGDNRVLLKDFIEFLRKYDMPIPQEYTQGKNNKVLVIDEELSVGKSIQRILNDSGYDTSIATNGFHASYKLLNEKPSFITLDLSMPDVDSYQIIDFIRATKEVENAKIIVISALGNRCLNNAIKM